MGNKKSNSYWEAELPSNYNRVGIENFIRAKYDSVHWWVLWLTLAGSNFSFSRRSLNSDWHLSCFYLLLPVRYVEKRWIPRDVNSKTSGTREERILENKLRYGTSDGNAKRSENLFGDRKIPLLLNNFQSAPTTQENRHSVLPKLAKQVKYDKNL